MKDLYHQETIGSFQIFRLSIKLLILFGEKCWFHPETTRNLSFTCEFVYSYDSFMFYFGYFKRYLKASLKVCPCLGHIPQTSDLATSYIQFPRECCIIKTLAGWNCNEVGNVPRPWVIELFRSVFGPVFVGWSNSKQPPYFPLLFLSLSRVPSSVGSGLAAASPASPAGLAESGEKKQD